MSGNGGGKKKSILRKVKNNPIQMFILDEDNEAMATEK